MLVVVLMSFVGVILIYKSNKRIQQSVAYVKPDWSSYMMHMTILGSLMLANGLAYLWYDSVISIEVLIFL